MTRLEALRLLSYASQWTDDDIRADPHSAWWRACERLGEARRLIEGAKR